MKKQFIFLLSISLFNIVSTLSAQKLSRTEKKIVAKVNSYEQEAIDFLEKGVIVQARFDGGEPCRQQPIRNCHAKVSPDVP